MKLITKLLAGLCIISHMYSCSSKTEIDIYKDISTTFYFGLVNDISNEDWGNFKLTEIGPRFEGFTELYGEGYLREGESYQETILIVIVHANTSQNRQHIEEIVDAFVSEFQNPVFITQEKVDSELVLS